MKKYLLTGLISLFALTVFVYITFDSVFDNLFVNILFLLFPLAAVLGSAYTFSKFNYNSARGKVFLFLMFGMLSWFLAELLWTVFVVFFDAEPFPSFIDIFYLLAYPLIITGFWLEYRMGKIKWNCFKALTVFLTSIILIALTAYFGVYYAYDADNALLENVFNIAYGVGDVILSIMALFILVIVMEYKRGKFFRPWLYIFIGIILMIFGDVLYSIYFEEYETGLKLYQYIDLFWVGSYLLMAYGFFSIGYYLTGMKNDIKEKLEKYIA